MATTEKTGLMTHIDEAGNKTVLYPVTIPDAVDGLAELLATKSPASHATDKNNPHGVTAAQIGAATLLQVYPVGSIYMSMNSASPASLFGGTWARLKDSFLLGASDTYAIGSMGGEKTHTLTINEIPSHTHQYSASYDTAPSGYGGGLVNSHNLYDYKFSVDNAGGGAAHNNMPPYVAVYMWQRTA